MNDPIDGETRIFARVLMKILSSPRLKFSCEISNSLVFAFDVFNLTQMDGNLMNSKPSDWTSPVKLDSLEFSHFYKSKFLTKIRPYVHL